MRKRTKIYLGLIFLLALITGAVFVDLPNGPYLKIKDRVIFKKEITIKEGLDLKGGAHLVYSADLSQVEESQKTEQMRSLVSAMENRINKFGVTEPTVQTSKVGSEYRLLIDLPGVKDANEAINSIGRVAELEFKELNPEQSDFVSVGITGKDLKSATADFNQNSGSPEILLNFTSEGAKKFEEVTARNVGKPIATYLDNEPIQTANVNEKISGGNAVITGINDIKEAKTIAKLLNAGRLPVPVKLIEQRTVGATLGQESIRMSIYAGVIGLIFVILFMIVYYRLLGLFSSIGLGLYAIFTLAFIKLVGVTLTMGGVAGLLLTVGMSVETDILVFERIREELRKGKSISTAVTLGFRKTWPTLWDSNAVTLIIAALLYTVGGTVRGFALVLAIGIFIGLFTTFFGTKTLIMIAIRYKLFQKNALFAVEKAGVTK